MTSELLSKPLQDQIDWIATEIRGIVAPLGGPYRLRNVNSHLGEIIGLVQDDPEVSGACEEVRIAAEQLYEARQLLGPLARPDTDPAMRLARELAANALSRLTRALVRATPS